MPMRVFHRRTAKMIAQRLCYLRRESAFSPESAAGSSEAKFDGSPFCTPSRRGGEAQIVCGALELA